MGAFKKSYKGDDYKRKCIIISLPKNPPLLTKTHNRRSWEVPQPEPFLTSGTKKRKREYTAVSHSAEGSKYFCDLVRWSTLVAAIESRRLYEIIFNCYMKNNIYLQAGYDDASYVKTFNKWWKLFHCLLRGQLRLAWEAMIFFFFFKQGCLIHHLCVYWLPPARMLVTRTESARPPQMNGVKFEWPRNPSWECSSALQP